MRVSHFYAENLTGILEGTGRREVEVDLEPAVAVGGRVLLQGRNGSGKSTLLKAISPFPTNGDGRDVFEPGRPARKTLRIVRADGSVVECDIRVSKAGKIACTMSVNGETVASTAKGNVGTYLEAVRAELGVTPAFLTIGRVGSNIGGFLDMDAARRKGYIGQFMPEVAEWAAMHKNASRRASAIRMELDGLRVELDAVRPREELETDRQRAESRLLEAQSAEREALSRLGRAEGAIGEMSPAREAVLREGGIDPASHAGELDPFPGIAEAAARAADAAAAQASSLLAQRRSLEPFAEPAACAEKIASLEGELSRAEGVRSGAAGARSEARVRVDRALQAGEVAARDLRRIENSGEQLSSLRDLEARQAADAARHARAAAGLPGLPDGLSYERVKTAFDALAQLEAELGRVRSAFPSDRALEEASRLEFDAGRVDATVARADARSKEADERAEACRAQLVSAESQAVFHRRFAHLKCNDPRCPYEAGMSQFANIDAEIAAMRERLADAERRAGDARGSLMEGAGTRAASAMALSLFRRISSPDHRPAYEAAGIWEAVGTAQAFAALVNSPASAAARVLDVKNLVESLAAKRQATEAQRALEATRARIGDLEGLVAAEAAIRESSARAEGELAAAREDLAAKEAKLAEVERAISGRQQAMELLRRLRGMQESEADHRARAARASELSGRLESLRERWDDAWAASVQAQADADAARESAFRHRREAESAAAALARRDEFERRVAAVNGRLSAAQVVSEACHPARGAPVEFIRDFLGVTRATVNDMLDVALRGEFRVDFVLTDSEFRIPVTRGSGRVIPDVSDASDGQLALAKTVISLALIKQTVLGSGGYNIFALDEIDGPLDRERNRQRFAEIVDRLVADLGAQQHFIISHNENFHAAPAGLILLPGHSLDLADPSFMGNKVVLADFS